MEDQSPQRQRIRTGVAIMAATALGLVIAVPSSASAGEAHLQPREVEGDPTCEDIRPEGADWAELRVDPPLDGEHGDGTLRVDLTLREGPDGQLLDGSGEPEPGVDPVIVHAVIVKGGPDANVYEYDGVVTEVSGLHAPPQDERFFDITHVSVCYEELEITGPLPPPPTTPPEPEEPEADAAPVVEAEPRFTG